MKTEAPDLFIWNYDSESDGWGTTFIPSVVIKIMEDYAKQISIEFSEWLNAEGWQQYDGFDRWICPVNNRNVYTTEQVYKLFKERK